MNARVPREKAIFGEALEITDPAQRRDFLDRACGPDKELREAVEKLLALSPRAGDFFEDCAPALAPAVADAARVLSAAEAARAPEIPETKHVGPYKLLQKLGEGGCGVVYMAEQEQPIRRRVALKIIKLGMDTRNVIARFEVERQALALMDHPNIARVLDAGATGTGRPYFVMELVYGVKITEYCDHNRVSMRERLQMFIQVCNAVQHAHQKGIIHRDLKPSNIMVTMHDGVPVPKVIDFGIAKATEQRLTDKTLFTSYAQLMGTPAYMSPEQMELSGLNLDTRSDIYALGVLLYELLTGRTPFDTTDLLKAGVDELRRTVREQEPLSPSAKLRTLNNEELTKTARRRHSEPPRLLSQLHGDLDWIVLKCLEKDRTRRYATAHALALDIERFLKEEAVLARPPSRWYRLQKLVRRNRTVFASGAVAVVALLVATIVSARMFLSERAARTSETRLRHEAERREKVSQVASLVTQGRFEEADKRRADLPLNKPSVEVSAELRALGEWHAAHGRWAETAARFESAMKVNQLDAPDLVSEARLKLAVALLKSGNRQGYEQVCRSPLAMLDPADVASEYRTFKVGLALPPDPNLLQLWGRGAQVVESRFPTDRETRPNPPHVAQWSEALALLEYRRGALSQALDWCYRCESYPAYSAARLSTTSLLKAMANWRLGRYRTAIVDWTLACALLQAKSLQGLDVGNGYPTVFPGTSEDLEGPWQDWVMADLLMRECDELIARSHPSLDSISQAEAGNHAAVVALARAQGEWHAIRGEWALASKRFAQVHNARQPDDREAAGDCYQAALALIKSGDLPGYARLRDATLTRFANTTDLPVARAVMQTVLLLPLGDTPTASLEPFIRLLARTEAGEGPSKEPVPDAFWDSMWLGLLEHRRGHHAEAMDLCRDSLMACAHLPMPTALNRITLAMSHRQLGNEAAARSDLVRARNLAQGGLNWGFDRWHWREWVFVRLLLQEADSMMGTTPLPDASR